MAKKKATKKAVTKKKAKTTEAASGDLMEKFLVEHFGKNADEIKALIAKDAQGEDSTVLEQIEEALEEEEEAKPKRAYQVTSLDDDELSVTKEIVIQTAKEMATSDYPVQTWGVKVGKKMLPPRPLYRAIFEGLGYEVDWDFNTYRALTLLNDHLGFECKKAD